jgi:LysR family carnitine catabolism transcriptional activator
VASNITVKQLKAFVAVAQAKSFAEACSLVHLSQPALSIAIKNLEEAVGGQLLARSTRTLALTPEGAEFLPVAQRLLSDWEGALDDLHNRFSLQRGRLAVAAMPSFASTQLPLIIRSFREKHPAINVSVHDIIAEDVVDMVRSGRVEIGVSFDPGDSEDLMFEPLFTDKFVAALPPAHPLLKHASIQWQHLSKEPFVALQRPSSVRELVDTALAEQKMFLSIQFEANQLVTIGQMVAAGLGVSAVPNLIMSQMQNLGVECRPLQGPSLSRKVGVITRRRYPLSTPAQAFLTELLDVA